MKTTLRFFGPLIDIFATPLSIDLDMPISTSDLEARLRREFPKLDGWKLRIAVDQRIVPPDAIIDGATEIALLPPFSGG